MCGIIGILGREDPEVGTHMLDRIAHRGPDGSGVWTDEGVTLGHRRLAILDVAHGQQPMTDVSGRYTIVYNGECYNHLLLRAELEIDGVAFATGTDTETVLAGFAKWGPSILEKMEGMFAFAIWDNQERRLFIARDPWGIKPFFHAFAHDGSWAFASEQKALFAHPDITPIMDVDRIKERGVLEFLTGQATLFQGVSQLPPGTWAWLQPGLQSVQWHPYYQVPAEAYASPDEAARIIRDRFVASIKEQLMAEVPLGVVLSGGLDSAAVAAIHQGILSDTPIQTFTVAESEEVADFQAARRLAEHLGTEHHETFFGFEDVWAGMPQWTWHNENINHTEFFFQPLFTQMRKKVTVGLCGQGSDELWGGYARYQSPRTVAEDRLERLHACRPAHMSDLEAQVAMTHMSGSSLAEWDQQGQLANFQLRLVDRTSMAQSLEVRVPFLSRPLHAASRAVPWAWKVHDGVEKWILRRALGDIGLPDDLLWRTKVPAGKATAPTAMQRFEHEAQRLISADDVHKHPIGCAFGGPAEMLVFKLWEELFIQREGERPSPNFRLEDLA